ncbi:aspartate ammonia-lyase [Pigmentibacter sp. JX0631]|uniref:aspartate ammonia-lyase n=1 Tax=Pigmentibacter sp. JX0631 TaxID=2976982 RepID=UPI0024692C13|nr:aspartate ammonia-lyase [Pigmentibacter sp. JX0631]WGL60081.1 aspartate ammonia-lyase [Pigmentibacter sp. JX0631]
MDIALISQFPLFANLSDNDLQILSNYLETLSVKKDVTLYSPGLIRDRLRLIVKGRIEVSAQTFDFEEPSTIYGPGQFLGEAALLEEGTLHKAKAQTVTDVDIIILTRAQFLKLMQENQEISCKIQMNIGSYVFSKLARGASQGKVQYSGYSSGKKRLEHDLLGDREISDEAYYGVQTLRAIENFNITGVLLSDFPIFIKGLAQVKKAAAMANCEIGILDQEICNYISMACDEIIAGHWHDQFLVDMIQGGAGTSTNMNANEVIANRALELWGKKKGEYKYIHPNNHVNLGQSTNDAYPTAIRLAALQSIPYLIEALEELCQTFSEKAKEFSDVIKMGRTQLQDAVPMTLGQEFEAFSVMLSEDIERIREGAKLFLELSIGGTAIGTGINAHPKYPATAVRKIKEITGLNVVSSPNLIEATPDTGAFVLFSGILKRLAVKLSKISNDLRLLSSGPRCGFGDINLPPMQPGSSIMPGKVNPVIPEVVNQIAFQVIGNDLTVTMASEGGQLQLNAFEPVMVFNIFQSVNMLSRGMRTLTRLCVKGITANKEACRRAVEHSIGLVTALNPLIGYENSTMIAKEALESGESVFNLVLKHKLLTREQLEEALKPENMLSSR